MANTTKLKPRRVNSFNEPSEGNNLWYKNDDQFNWQDWWWSWWYQSFFKTQAEYDALPQSKESDNNLYIIVNAHIRLLEYEELIALTLDEALEELNKAPVAYYNKYYSGWHITLFDGEAALYNGYEWINIWEIGWIPFYCVFAQIWEWEDRELRK